MLVVVEEDLSERLVEGKLVSVVEVVSELLLVVGREFLELDSYILLISEEEF